MTERLRVSPGSLWEAGNRILRNVGMLTGRSRASIPDNLDKRTDRMYKDMSSLSVLGLIRRDR